MKTLLLTLGTVVGLAAAQAHALTDLSDADADGRYTMEEVRAAFPSLTPQAFAAADSDGNGLLDKGEVKAAIAAGTLAAG